MGELSQAGQAKPTSQATTECWKDSSDPNWDFSVELLGYKRGDVLTFNLLGSGGADPLGKVSLAIDRSQGTTWGGELELDSQGTLKVQVELLKAPSFVVVEDP